MLRAFSDQRDQAYPDKRAPGQPPRRSRSSAGVERAAQRLLKCRRVGFQGKVTRFVAVTEAGKEFILPHPDLLQCIAEAADVLDSER